jgi:hypothetical protein
VKNQLGKLNDEAIIDVYDDIRFAIDAGDLQSSSNSRGNQKS